MKVHQTIVYNDEVIYDLASMTLQNGTSTITRFSITVLGIGLTAYSVLFASGEQRITFLIYGIVFFLAGMFVAPNFMRRRAMIACQSLRGKSTTYVVDDDMIHCQAGPQSVNYRWEDVLLIHELEEALGIMLKDRRIIILEKKKMTKEEVQWILSHNPKKK